MALSKSVKGTFWSMLERFSTMGVQLLCTLVIAQFLNPLQFGLVGMMSIFLAFSTILVDAGFGQAIIREKSVTQLDYSSIFYFNLLLGGGIYISVYFAAPIISSFYEEPQLKSLVRISFLSLIFLAFSVVQQAKLFKTVNFSTVSKISLYAAVISSVIGIVVAYAYKNVWALVSQSLTFSFFRTVLLWIYSDWMPNLQYSFSSIKKYLRFSLNLLGSNLIAAVTDNLANLFIGKSYSAKLLGNYTIPDKLQRSVAGTLSFSIHRVSYPIMSSFQDDNEHLKNYSQKVVGMAFYIIAPIMILLGLVSEDFFAILLSPDWAESAIYFKYMCVIGAVYCFADINMDILLVKGLSSWVLRIEIVRKSVLILALIIGIRYKIEILLLLLIGYNLFNAVFVSYFAGKSINCSLTYQLKKNYKTLLSLLVMIVTVKSILQIIYLPFMRFSISLVIGILTYILCSYILRNAYWGYFVTTVKNMLCKFNCQQ